MAWCPFPTDQLSPPGDGEGPPGMGRVLFVVDGIYFPGDAICVSAVGHPFAPGKQGVFLHGVGIGWHPPPLSPRIHQYLVPVLFRLTVVHPFRYAQAAHSSLASAPFKEKETAILKPTGFYIYYWYNIYYYSRCMRPLWLLKMVVLTPIPFLSSNEHMHILTLYRYVGGGRWVGDSLIRRWCLRVIRDDRG